MQKNLTTLRREIDEVDGRIVQLLAERMRIVENVAEYKKEHDLPALAPERWAQVIESKKQLAAQHKIDPTFIEQIFNAIHEFSLQQQEKYTDES